MEGFEFDLTATPENLVLQYCNMDEEMLDAFEQFLLIAIDAMMRYRMMEYGETGH